MKKIKIILLTFSMLFAFKGVVATNKKFNKTPNQPNMPNWFSYYEKEMKKSSYNELFLKLKNEIYNFSKIFNSSLQEMTQENTSAFLGFEITLEEDIKHIEKFAEKLKYIAEQNTINYGNEIVNNLNHKTKNLAFEVIDCIKQNNINNLIKNRIIEINEYKEMYGENYNKKKAANENNYKIKKLINDEIYLNKYFNKKDYFQENLNKNFNNELSYIITNNLEQIISEFKLPLKDINDIVSYKIEQFLNINNALLKKPQFIYRKNEELDETIQTTNEENNIVETVNKININPKKHLKKK